jgi:hypothetical protein
MAISSIVREYNLSGSTANLYLNHPANAGMSDGYWYYYSSSTANNTLTAKIKPHRWGSPLSIVNGGNHLSLDGTSALISESIGNRSKVFHGGTIVRIGQGSNDVTSLPEDDAFFFYHIGSLNASDTIGYWDRAFLEAGTSDWDYYQYHQHNPNVYPDYENGRLTFAAPDYINPTDKKYGYVQPVTLSTMGTSYQNILSRIHQPSIGGAHSSHTDLNLGGSNTSNYFNAGIITGTSDRFHAFYLRASGSQWEVYSKTYNLASNNWTAENNHGVYDLADPNFNPVAITGTYNTYPLRASAGALSGSSINIPVIYNGSGGTYDLRVWKFPSANTLLTADLSISTIVSSSIERPDCHIKYINGYLTAVVSNTINGGVNYYKYSGSNWVNQGQVVTNGKNEVIRIHGYDYNTTDSKYYLLLSGDITGSGPGAYSGSYSGSGVYSFSDTQPFDGYKHLSFQTGSYGFITRNALQTGYVKMIETDGSLEYKSGSEPQSISDTEQILQYEIASPQFIDRKETTVAGDSYFYDGIQLSDGRVVFVGNIENNEGNIGGKDLFMAIYPESEGERDEFYAVGTTGDEYFTSIVEDTTNKRLWMTGYTKGYLAEKRDIKVHGFGRGIIDGNNSLQWDDIKIDSNGNQYLVGYHNTNENIIAAKYDYNFELVWQKNINASGSATTGSAIALDSSGSIYIAASTRDTGSGGVDAFVAKLNQSGSIVWSRAYGSSANQYASSIEVITKASTEYLVVPVVSGSSTTVLVLNQNGGIVEQNTYSEFVVNKVRKSDSETNGFFLLAGRDNTTPSKAKFAKGQVQPTGNMIKWLQTYSTGTTASIAYDIKNTESASVAGGLGSLTGPRYVVVGKDGSNAFALKFVVDEDSGTFQSTKIWGRNLTSSSFNSVEIEPYTESGSRYVYAAGFTSASVEGQGGSEGFIVKFDNDGNRIWSNTLGHTNDEKILAITSDITNNNIITAGWSESHSDGRRTFLFRSDKSGFGTGNYHLEGFPGMQMWYASSSLSTNLTTGSLGTISSPSNNAAALTLVSGTFEATDAVYSQEIYDGGVIWDMFIGKLDLESLQEHKNTEEHKLDLQDQYISAEYIDNIFTFYQFGAAGDGVADDGNFFGYDILIMSGSDELFVTGQTSGEIAKNNLGGSGVYDYILTRFNPNTHEWEFYQNGTSADEEVYGATVINNGSGSIAFVGRTTGNLGGTNLGGYDLFLGIYNPITDVINYYQTGSLADDRAINVHDVGNNEIAIVYETSDKITTDATSAGGVDIGVIKFNYSSSLWSTSSYQAGTELDEILSNDGKPSLYLTDNRIMIVGKTLGVFSDDNTIYGNNDIFLGILDLSTGTYKKYQVGTGANETGTCVFFLGGGKICIGGYNDGSFTGETNAIFTKFDTIISLKGKSE